MVMELRKIGKHAMRVMLGIMAVGMTTSVAGLAFGSGAGTPFLAAIVAGVLVGIAALAVLVVRRTKGRGAAGREEGDQPAPWAWTGAGWGVSETPVHERSATLESERKKDSGDEGAHEQHQGS